MDYYLLNRFSFLIIFVSLLCTIVVIEGENDQISHGSVMVFTKNNNSLKTYSIRKTEEAYRLNFSRTIHYGMEERMDLSQCQYDKGEKEMLFCFDKLLKVIFKLDIDSDVGIVNSIEPFYREISSSECQIALDPLRGNLYVSDKLFQNIKQVPIHREHSESAISVSVVPEAGLVTALACDPIRKLLFWASDGTYTKIWKAGLNGEDKNVLINNIQTKITTVVVNVETGTLYWIDHRRNTLEYISYDGTKRGILPGVFTEHLQNFVFFDASRLVTSTDHELAILEIASNGASSTLTKAHLTEPSSLLTIIPKSQNAFSDDCLRLQCQHLCVNKENSAQCECMKGYLMHSDKRSCLAPDTYVMDGLFFVLNSSVCWVGFSVLTGVKSSPSCFHQIQNATLIEIDPLRRSIILVSTNGSRYQISVFDFDVPTFHLHFVYSSFKEIQALTYDMEKRRIFWYEADMISMHSLQENTTSILLRNVSHLSSLKYDPISNSLYLCSKVFNKVESLSLTTNIRTEIGQLIGPSHIEIDPVSERLVTTVFGGVMTMKKNGADIRVLKTWSEEADTFMVYKGFSIRTVNGNDTTTLKTFHMDTRESVQSTAIGGHATATDISILDISIYNKFKDLCNFENGVCEQICTFNNSVTCTCLFGYTVNGSVCETESVENPIMMYSKSERQLYAMDKSGVKTVILNVGSFDNIDDLDVDSDNGVLFVAVYSQQTIIQYHIQDGKAIAIPVKDIKPSRIAYYHSQNELIVAGLEISRNKTALYGYSLSTKSTKKTKDTDTLADIAVYDKLGYLYAIEGVPPEIIKINLTSLEETRLSVPAIRTPSRIITDEIAGILYVIDKEIDSVFRMGLDGKYPQIIFSESGAGIQDISIDSDYIYITARNRRFIFRKNKVPEGILDELTYPVQLGHVGVIHANYDYYCPKSIGSLAVSENCSRRIGDICEIRCQSNFVTLERKVYVKCEKTGLWNASSDLCKSDQASTFPTAPTTVFTSPESITNNTLSSTNDTLSSSNETLSNETSKEKSNSEDTCNKTPIIVVMAIFIVLTLLFGIIAGYFFWISRRSTALHENISD